MFAIITFSLLISAFGMLGFLNKVGPSSAIMVSIPLAASMATDCVLITRTWIVLGSLLSNPSFTMSWATYKPGMSGTNVVTFDVGDSIADRLPAGMDANDH